MAVIVSNLRVSAPSRWTRLHLIVAEYEQARALRHLRSVGRYVSGDLLITRA